MNFRKLKIAALVSSLALCSSLAQAGTAYSTINATMNVVGTCSFNQPTYTVTVNGTTGQKPTGNVQVFVQCSSGLTATLQQGYAKAYSGSGALGEVEAVAYKDAGNTQPLAGNAIDLTADNNMNPYTIYYMFRDYQSEGPIQKTGTFEISMPMQVNF